MKKRKKGLAGLLSVVLLCMNGCGVLGGEAAGSSQTSEINEELSGIITIWEHDYSFEECLVAVIEGFQELYPNVEVKYQIKADGDYDSLLKTTLQSGDGPDLFWSNGTATDTFPELVESGACMDLTSVVDFSFIEENSDIALQLGSIDEEIYSTQWLTLDTNICYYNIDMFEENGWKVPSTFSEFEQLLEQIYADGVTPLSMALDSWCLVFAYQPILAAYDPDYCRELSDCAASVTEEPALEAMEKMVEWSQKGYFGKDWYGIEDSNEQLLSFTSGETAMVITGSWNTTTFIKNNPNLHFGAFAIPSESGSTVLVGAAANGFSVNANTNNPEAALAFANYCTSREAQTLWVQTQEAFSATAEIESSSDIAGEITQNCEDILYAGWRNVLSKSSEDGTAEEIFLEDFTKIFTGEMSAEELMEEIAAGI